MHREVVQLRLAEYVSNISFTKPDFDDGYYRFLIQLKIDNKQDSIKISRIGFDKYLSGLDVDIDHVEARKPRVTFQTYLRNLIGVLTVIALTTIIISIIQGIYHAS